MGCARHSRTFHFDRRGQRVKILLLNSGSSSLKCTLMEPADHRVIARGLADWAGATTHYEYEGPDGSEHREDVPWRGHADAVRRFLHDLQNVAPVAVPDWSHLAGVGHRFVHGGKFTASVRIDVEVRQRLTELVGLAPLHNPPSLAALSAAQGELPEVPHIAVFDTAFHATLAPEAYTYPVPQPWTHDWGVRRYGFHGLSFAYCGRRAAEMLGRPIDGLRLVVCHLGHGCSAAAIRSGRSVDTTMGFTPLEGLMMGTRSGTIDPSIITYIEQRHGLSPADVDQALNRQSGLLGVSGISGDMRDVVVAAQQGDVQARLAFDIYTHRIRQAIGGLTVTLGGIDALIFTAGVGEHSAPVRAAVCRGLECLGLALDVHANESCQADADIARPASSGRILVIATREDVTMVREVIGVLKLREK